MFDEFETHEEKDYLEVQLTENTEEKEDRETKELPRLKVANAPSGNLFFWSALIHFFLHLLITYRPRICMLAGR